MRATVLWWVPAAGVEGAGQNLALQSQFFDGRKEGRAAQANCGK